MNEFSMHDAAREGDLCRVRQLIESGVPVDSLDKDGLTPLHMAARYGQYEVAALLINSECNLNIKDHSGNTPVRLAACSRRNDVVVLLLHHGALIDGRDEGWTLLHDACSNIIGWTDILRLILDYGEADLNAVNRDGCTPLMYAAKMSNDRAAALLIRAGADVNRSDVNKKTALHYASMRYRHSVKEVLLEKEGLDLNPQDVDGDTPLHLACQNGWQIEILLDAGANTNIKNNRGRTALSEGIIRRHYLKHKDIKLFVQKGAFLENSDIECISQDRFLQKNVLTDVELCTQSIVNKFNRQSLPALKSIPYFARRLPNVNNFKLGARHIDEVENLVKCEIEKNTFCNVVKVHPTSLSALCVLSLITFQSGKKRAASPDFDHSPFKKIHN